MQPICVALFNVYNFTELFLNHKEHKYFHKVHYSLVSFICLTDGYLFKKII